jgi:hypothetical protein
MIKTYKIAQKAGITDLRGYLGDLATEWWTDKDWEKWNAGAEEREKWNENYIKELKEKDEFGKEYDLEMHLQENSLFDTPKIGQPIESYKMIFLDLSK